MTRSHTDRPLLRTLPDRRRRGVAVWASWLLVPLLVSSIACGEHDDDGDDETDFPPSSTRLADVETYVTYYQQDAARLAELTELDLAIVQPVLTEDRIRSLQSHGKAAVYLSIGEIGLSNTYVYEGEVVLGQVIYDDHPEWFIAQNPFFDSWFADTRETGWQDFVVEQAELLIEQGYDGLFMDTVDTVDVYPETIPGMVALIARLRALGDEVVLVQNRGINIIDQTGEDVDALMFEVFNTYYDSVAMDYLPTDVDAPGYAGLVEKADAYRQSGGVVLSQDFALPEPAYEDLICDARERALSHGFIPSYADKFFQEGLFPYPDACPWPLDPGYEVVFEAPVGNVSRDSITVLDVSIEGRLGYAEPVDLALGTTPAGVTATLGATTLAPGESTTLTLEATGSAAIGASVLEVEAESESRDETLTLALVVHDETAWVTNAGLSRVVAFDDPATLPEPPLASRRSAGTVAQPYDVEIDGSGAAWVVENVGDPGAAQPAGRILRYAPFDLQTPEAIFDTGLDYPTGLAIADDGRVWIANSALDWTGTPRATPNLATIAPSASAVSAGFGFEVASYGYPRSVALDGSGSLWVATTYGLIIGFAAPSTLSGTVAPGVVIVGVGGDVDLFDTARDLTFDSEGDLWMSGSLSGVSRIVEIDASALVGSPTILDAADVPTVLTAGLLDPWGIAFGENGDLWVVNATDSIDDSESSGSLLHYAAGDLANGASPTSTSNLSSRYTLGLDVARP